MNPYVLKAETAAAQEPELLAAKVTLRESSLFPPEISDKICKLLDSVYCTGYCRGAEQALRETLEDLK